MGAQGSQEPRPEPVPEQEAIVAETGCKERAASAEGAQFPKPASAASTRDGKGYLNRCDLEGIGQLAVNPIGDRIINAFFPDGGEEADFRSFAHVLAHFRPVEAPGSPEDINSHLSKLKFAFQLYDQDKDGKISRAEMLQVLRMMVGLQVTNDQLENITDRTIQEADRDGDNAISFEEFAKSVEKLNIERKMSLRILK